MKILWISTHLYVIEVGDSYSTYTSINCLSHWLDTVASIRVPCAQDRLSESEVGVCISSIWCSYLTSKTLYSKRMMYSRWSSFSCMYILQVVCNLWLFEWMEAVHSHSPLSIFGQIVKLSCLETIEAHTHEGAGAGRSSCRCRHKADAGLQRVAGARNIALQLDNEGNCWCRSLRMASATVFPDLAYIHEVRTGARH